MASDYSLAVEADEHTLAWDLLTESKPGSCAQPWREFWPPTNVDAMTPEEVEEQPWLTWKRDPSKPNEKPWYKWCNIFKGEVDVPCKRNEEGRGCEECGGRGCDVCSTVAEGG
ncbi:hypothetical protein PG985_010163 [Apiospora marii]|uniref:Uncharacterized protein n=1 Tax=Apiospora marii TaxID=335849 RepID=A0ABR1RL32_9PEZI